MTDSETPAPSLPVTQVTKSDGKSANVSLQQLMRQLSVADQAQSKGAENSPAPAETTPASPAPQPEAPAAPAEPVAEGTALTAPPEPPTPEPEASADEALSHEPSLAPELQAVIDKRIGKEVAKRKAMEAELAQLREKVGKPAESAPNLPPAAPITVAPTPEQPLANVQDYQSLKRIEEETRNIKYIAQEGIDSIESSGNDAFQINNETYNKAQLKVILRNASRSLEEQIPKRVSFLQQRDQAVQRALQTYEWMKDPNSPEYNQGLAVLRNPQYAYLHYSPDGIEQLGLMIEGQKAVRARTTPPTPAKPKPVQPTKAPASQVAFGAAATGSTRTSASAQADGVLGDELKKLSAKGNVTARDAARFLSRKEQLQSTRS